MRSILFLIATTAICLPGAVFAQDTNSKSGGATETVDDPATDADAASNVPVTGKLTDDLITPGFNPSGAGAGSGGYYLKIVGDMVKNVPVKSGEIINGAGPASGIGGPVMGIRPASG